MAANTRNSKVVALLVGSMTFGAALLLWLEPQRPTWRESTPLLAQRGVTIQEVTIDYVREGDAVVRDNYDCVVDPDGACDWAPRGPAVRLLVVGSAGKVLPEKQAKSLLAVLANMSQAHQLDVRPNAGRVRLAATADAERDATLPAQARHLRQLLERKQIIN